MRLGQGDIERMGPEDSGGGAVAGTGGEDWGRGQWGGLGHGTVRD